MKYYDARIIEGCCVFSYTVDTPESETEKNIPAQKKSNEKPKQQKNCFWKKFFLPFLLLLAAPFALLADGICLIVKKSVALFRRVYRECEGSFEVVTCILVAVSATALIPLVFLFL